MNNMVNFYPQCLRFQSTLAVEHYGLKEAALNDLIRDIEPLFLHVYQATPGNLSHDERLSCVIAAAVLAHSCVELIISERNPNKDDENARKSALIRVIVESLDQVPAPRPGETKEQLLHIYIYFTLVYSIASANAIRISPAEVKGVMNLVQRGSAEEVKQVRDYITKLIDRDNLHQSYCEDFIRDLHLKSSEIIIRARRNQAGLSEGADVGTTGVVETQNGQQEPRAARPRRF